MSVPLEKCESPGSARRVSKGAQRAVRAYAATIRYRIKPGRRDIALYVLDSETEGVRSSQGQLIPVNVRHLLKKELAGDFTLGIKFCSNRYRMPPPETEQMTLGRIRPKKSGIVKLAASVVGTGGCIYRVDLSKASARVLGGDHCYNE